MKDFRRRAIKRRTEKKGARAKRAAREIRKRTLRVRNLGETVPRNSPQTIRTKGARTERSFLRRQTAYQTHTGRILRLRRTRIPCLHFHELPHLQQRPGRSHIPPVSQSHRRSKSQAKGHPLPLEQDRGRSKVDTHPFYPALPLLCLLQPRGGQACSPLPPARSSVSDQGGCL